MKATQNITTLLLAIALTLLLSACNAKTTQDENNTTSSQNPATQNTNDTSTIGTVTGGATQNGGTAATNSGTIASSGDSSNDSSTGNSSNNTKNANTNTASNNTTTGGGDNDDNATTDGGTDDNVTTGGNNNNTTTGGNNNSTDYTTTAPTSTLKSLKLTVAKTSLNKEENTTLYRGQVIMIMQPKRLLYRGQVIMIMQPKRLCSVMLDCKLYHIETLFQKSRLSLSPDPHTPAVTLRLLSYSISTERNTAEDLSCEGSPKMSILGSFGISTFCIEEKNDVDNCCDRTDGGGVCDHLGDGIVWYLLDHDICNFGAGVDRIFDGVCYQRRVKGDRSDLGFFCAGVCAV